MAIKVLRHSNDRLDWRVLINKSVWCVGKIKSMEGTSKAAPGIYGLQQAGSVTW